MSLKEEFEPDFYQVFSDPNEFGDLIRFEIIERGLSRQFMAQCVWDTDTLKQRSIVSQQGVFLGTVLLFIAKEYFPIRPKAEEVLYRLNDRNNYREPWIILDITDAESVYEIYLDRISV
jgi:hypothetical protein